MKIIVQHESNDPAWNLALEQTLLETAQEDLFLLWQNGPSVIVGRNQNTRAEVDEGVVEALGLPVVRRMTGGGAVYHDLGNLNFSYIECQAGGHFGDFARYTKPVLDALRRLGIHAELGGRNDLLADGRKISGNAQCLWRGRMLHHGTLLYDADLSALGRVLRPDPAKLAEKGVASVRSRVTNLRALSPTLTLDQLLDALCEGFQAYGAERTSLRPEDREAAEALANIRYRSHDWNWGIQKPYAWQRRERLPQGGYEISLDLQDGVIRTARLQGDFMAVLPVQLLTDALAGVAHTPQAIAEALRPLPVEQITGGLSQEALCALLT